MYSGDLDAFVPSRRDLIFRFLFAFVKQISHVQGMNRQLVVCLSNIEKPFSQLKSPSSSS